MLQQTVQRKGINVQLPAQGAGLQGNKLLCNQSPTQVLIGVGLLVRGRLICFILLPRGHFETINSTWETRCGSSSQSNVPSKAGKRKFIYFSTCPSLHHFPPEAPFCFWSAPEGACPEFCCLKDRGNTSLLQSKFQIHIFYCHSQSGLFAWGISLLIVPSLHHAEKAPPDRLFPHLYLPVLFYTAAWNQAWAEKSWMSPK